MLLKTFSDLLIAPVCKALIKKPIVLSKVAENFKHYLKYSLNSLDLDRFCIDCLVFD